MERAWGRAEREWRKEYQKQVTLLPIIFWTVYRALFRELPGKDVPLDRDAVEEFEDFVNSEEIQKAIDQVIDVCAMVESGAPRLVRETQGHHLPATEGKRGPRGPYQLPLERRLELIRYVRSASESSPLSAPLPSCDHGFAKVRNMRKSPRMSPRTRAPPFVKWRPPTPETGEPARRLQAQEKQHGD
jgi:hypothetical protein